MSEQYDSLNEKAKLIDISLTFTGGDLEKAKAMASGQFDDCVVIKGKFFAKEQGQSGLFLAFFNIVNEYIANISSVITSNASVFEKVRVFDDWKSLFNDIIAFKSGDDTVETESFNNFLVDSFVKFDIFPDVNELMLEGVTNTVNEIIKKYYNVSNVQSQIELSTTSSLNMDLAGVVIDIPGSLKDSASDGAGRQDQIDIVEDERITKIENEADYIVEGKSVIAPVKGKYINDINVGEKIKLQLAGNDVIADKVLRALNAIDDEGTKYPITGRIKEKIPMEKSGYIVYALVAKGILAKIIEEENIKILIDKPIEEVIEETKKADNKMMYIMAIAVGLIILAGLILLVIL